MSSLSYSQAINEVKAQVAASRTSFHAGMSVLPKARREGMYALYGFCRVVDDIADDSPSPEIAKQGLQLWREHIAQAFKDRPSNAITIALQPAIHNFKLSEKDFLEIIDGMEMDSVAIIAPDMPTLDIYCDRVASAVGRISVCIFGDCGTYAMQVAYHLGRALQLTNILRDLAEDAARGRLYLPSELLAKHGIKSRNPMEVLLHQNLSMVCRDLAVFAQDHYTQADAFMKKCEKAAMRPARIMRAYYGAIFNRLIKLDWRDPSKRVTLPKWKKITLMTKGFFS
jgi:phytoene synthase